jgi:peptidoglycan/LPS O-acetylase OafA/YrhL
VKSQYVSEIDGLRAVAVLSVIFYHVGFEAFGGGFVGVDVFFVISGFLITRLIRDEFVQKGEFSFVNFYARRVRRLFPALAVTIAVSLIASMLLFSPQQLIRTALSALAALFSVSNILFWMEADYFDAFAATKPFLHTWSLSVEEQFYFIWPVTLVFMMSRLPGWGVPAVILLLCVASLAVAEAWIPRDRAGAFFLLPTRVAELGVGALLVWLVGFRPRNAAALEALCFAGLGLIVFACLAFTEQTPFPGVNALAPCVGAALVIFASSARYAAAPLRTAAFVWIGKISYSLYLVHWPLIVFYGAFLFDDFSLAERWLLVAASVTLAALQHRFVEERFRHVTAGSMPAGRFMRRAALVAAAFAIPTGVIVASNGLPGRIPEDRFAMTNRDQRHEVERLYCGRPDPRLDELFTCQNYRGAEKDIIIWGDSHAMHLAPGFAKWFPDHNVSIAFQPACVPQRGFGEYVGSAERAGCVAHNREVLERLRRMPPTTIVLSGAKRGAPEVIAGASREIIARLEERGHTVAMLGDVIVPGADRDLADCGNVPGWILSDERIAARCVGDPDTVASELAFNETLAALVPQFVPINDVQCPEGDCTFFENGAILFRDNQHLNIQGAEFFVGAIRERLPLR